MINKALVFGVLVAGAAAFGCSSSSSGDGIKPENQKLTSDAAAAAQKVSSFDQLSPDDKAKFMKMANNNEQGARAVFNMIKNPPNAGILASHGGGTAGGSK